MVEDLRSRVGLSSALAVSSGTGSRMVDDLLVMEKRLSPGEAKPSSRLAKRLSRRPTRFCRRRCERVGVFAPGGAGEALRETPRGAGGGGRNTGWGTDWSHSIMGATVRRALQRTPPAIA